MVIAGSLSAGVILLWLGLVTWYNKHYPPPPPVVAHSTTQPSATEPATEPTSAATSQSSSSVAATKPSTGPSTGPSLAQGLHAIESAGAGATADNSAVLGSADKKQFRMQVYLTPRGAGVERVILNEFKKSVREPEPYTFQQPYDGHPGTEPFASQSVVVDGVSVNLMGAPWKLLSHNETSATYQVTIADGQTPVAQVAKTYTLSNQLNAGDMGYQMRVEQTIKAIGDRGLKIQQEINGPTSPPREIERSGDVSVLAGFAASARTVDVAQHLVDGGDFKPGKEPLNLTDDGSHHHALWAGQASTYFNALVLPEVGGSAGRGFKVDARALDSDDPNEKPDDRRIVMSFSSDPVDLKPDGQAASMPLSIYLGPKDRTVLKTGYYTAFPRMYNLTLVIRGGFCGFCTWDWLVDWLFAILWVFHWIFRDWGIAIICLVLLVRGVLHPLTKAGQVQMMKMQKYGPEIEKLKKKYGDDKEGLNKEMMKFYQEQGYGLGPMLGCAPMFLQMPIWIALWSALQSTFELRQAPFLYGLTWIKDLAKPDGLITFSHPITLPLIIFAPTIYSLNILPLLMAVATFVNQKYFMPTPPITSPEQAQTQKMTRVMSAFFPLMFYPFPSGLNLYYLTSMSLGILESKIIRDHIKEREEAEKSGRVFVTTKATRGARQGGGGGGNINEPPVKPGIVARLMMRMAQMQQQVEQLRDDQQKKGNKGRKQ
jgi:YidC/Oxa1 family membrane protein insertase